MSPRRPSRPIRNQTNYELARELAPLGPQLLELHRRFCAEEARLAATLGADDPPTFEDLVRWIVDRGSRPPHRPRGRRERPIASLNRSRAAFERHRRRREQAVAEGPPVEAAA